jgi:hypothetical protein
MYRLKYTESLRSFCAQNLVSQVMGDTGLTVFEVKVLRRRLEQRDSKRDDNGGKCVAKNFIICTIQLILFAGATEGRCGRQEM